MILYLFWNFEYIFELNLYILAALAAKMQVFQISKLTPISMKCLTALSKGLSLT
jgi:hypothetical protein